MVVSFFTTAKIAMSNSSICQTEINFNFYGDTIHIPWNKSSLIDFKNNLSEKNIENFYNRLQQTDYSSILNVLLTYKEEKKANDWIYYQLIRKTVQQISPKTENYERYTLYKWFFLAKSGYDTRLVILGDKILFYVYSDDNIYDLPVFSQNNRQYVCLNYHDYGKIDFEKQMKDASCISIPYGKKSFSYKVSRLPDFNEQYSRPKDLTFNYKNRNYHFRIELNPEVDTIFKNYPVVDFDAYFNIPLSKKTYQSLIPKLKDEIKGLETSKGVDYLMEFTRNAFLYEDDRDNFGKEKRLSPEQTLFNKYSDCDDRVALFFYLVKEIYNRPMIVMLYPTHVSIAVNFEKNIGKPVFYNNMAFTVCDPTPQQEELSIGELARKYKNQEYTIAYAYTP